MRVSVVFVKRQSGNTKTEGTFPSLRQVLYPLRSPRILLIVFQTLWLKIDIYLNNPDDRAKTISVMTGDHSSSVKVKHLRNKILNLRSPRIFLFISNKFWTKSNKRPYFSNLVNWTLIWPQFLNKWWIESIDSPRKTIMKGDKHSFHKG